MNSQEKVLDTLVRSGPSTILELSNQLNLTKADIRYHMKYLIQKKQVVKTFPEGMIGRGRPAAKFEFNEMAPAKLMIRMVSALYESTQRFYTQPSSRNALIQMIIDSLTSDFRPVGPPIARINETVNYLRQFGIFINWEATPKGPKYKILKEPISILITDQDFSHTLVSDLVDRLFAQAVIQSPQSE
jgi:predicted ArsR family transcriptional regulator